ncbi:3-(3-hydroxy-phenyl)propionate hydroxylase [Mesorhizobium sp. J18]|uniref:FAD-dependent oxidoreductase n=1 Tax=Mesorhizobium sp. J18 TaxID=935263 RepID=UPI00119B0D4B|nr:FAD-dependent oxidoreductase [Mesorhizobium sp. J18]TWG93209.1 3-(3-hydroxy-phenyl)propionate hydroxylase [Mesorhizobium sp. J18]
MPRYVYKPFGYRRLPEFGGKGGARCPVAIVGAGPVGLAAAIDLALHGVRTVVLDDNDVVSIGSRAICWSKRTLEIFDRLGVGERMVEKGVTWKVGRLFHRDREVWSFDLLPELGHKMPAFVNLQQYYVEQYLAERAADFPDLIDLRWKNKVIGIEPLDDHVRIGIETPDGPYGLEASWLIACDGARSPVRGMLGLEFQGRVFEERFLIADVEMQADFPSERWFWFEPPFHSGQSALLHKQPDNIYRIDLQLGSDADPEEEKKPENVIPRIEKVIGHRDFELDWVSVYAFQCRRLEKFVHGRIVFAGDSAHIVSPFGARGGNGGIQDVDNLVWKLAMVLKDSAPESLIATYEEERIHGADENILNSARATSFMTPKTEMERIFRDSVLALAVEHEFARRLVNSGRLSRPCSLAGKSLQTPCDEDDTVTPGEPMTDAPLEDGEGRSRWLLNAVGGDFALLCVGAEPPQELPSGLRAIAVATASHRLVTGDLQFVDTTGAVAKRYGDGTTYLVRPDQHIAASFRAPSSAAVKTALERATGRTSE